MQAIIITAPGNLYTVIEIEQFLEIGATCTYIQMTRIWGNYLQVAKPPKRWLDFLLAVVKDSNYNA